MCYTDGYGNSEAEEIPTSANRTRDELLNDGEVPIPAERKIPAKRPAADFKVASVQGSDMAPEVTAMFQGNRVLHYRGEGQDERIADNMLAACKQDPGQVYVGDDVYTHELVFDTPTFKPIMRVLGGLSLFLAVKNMKYGNSALEPKRVFSRASAEEQLLVRLDDKVSRLMNRKEDELAKNDVVDIIGYLILYCVMRGWFSFRDLLD